MVFAALADAGGLEYSESFDSDEALLSVVAHAAMQARSDPSLLVKDDPSDIFWLESATPPANAISRAAFWKVYTMLNSFRGANGLFYSLSAFIRILSSVEWRWLPIALFLLQATRAFQRSSAWQLQTSLSLLLLESL